MQKDGFYKQPHPSVHTTLQPMKQWALIKLLTQASYNELL